MERHKTLTVYKKTTVQPYKAEWLQAFAIGAKIVLPFVVDYSDTTQYKHTDFAMIFNYQLQPINVPHLKLRQTVQEKQENKNIFFFDSDVLISYSKVKTETLNNYVRIPFRDVYPDKALYFNDNFKSDRWNKFAIQKHIKLKEYRKDGDHILICCNRGSGGYSAFGINAANWAIETATELRKHTERTIVIRLHPGARADLKKKDYKRLMSFAHQAHSIRITGLSKTEPLINDIRGAWATVIFTSTAGAMSLIEGVPVFVCHPSSYLNSVNAGKLSDIENPKLYNRETFLHKLAYTQWNIEELKDGTFFRSIMDRGFSKYV